MTSEKISLLIHATVTVKEGLTPMGISPAGTLLYASSTIGAKSQNMFILKEFIMQPHPFCLAAIWERIIRSCHP